MDFACLQNGLDQLSSQLSSVEKDEVLGLVLFSVLLALPCAPVVLGLYQRRVQKLMSLSTQTDAASAVPSAPAEPNETSRCPWLRVDRRIVVGSSRSKRARFVESAGALCVGFFSRDRAGDYDIS
jgi:hypothetical protein